MVRTHDGRDILIAAVADGAGSAKRSEVGAALAISLFLEEFGDAISSDPELLHIDQDFVNDWLDGVRDAIAARATSEGLEPRDFACTFLAAIVGQSECVCFQIGDGAIVISDDEVGAYQPVFWPQHGEFANTTNFVTQDHAHDVVMFKRCDSAIQEIALFSDGIERLVLDLSAKAVYTPSLRPIFDWLSTTEPSTSDDGPTRALLTYLGSEHVNRRTDDDKTLVMATRALPPQERPSTGA